MTDLKDKTVRLHSVEAQQRSEAHDAEVAAKALEELKKIFNQHWDTKHDYRSIS